MYGCIVTIYGEQTVFSRDAFLSATPPVHPVFTGYSGRCLLLKRARPLVCIFERRGNKGAAGEAADADK